MSNSMHPAITKAAASLKWSALMEIVTRAAKPITVLALGRLLSPEDFGILATALIIISFCQIFWDAGLSGALIQTEESKEEVADIVFWTNLILGILVYILVFISSPWIAAFFDSPASKPVLQVLGLQIVIASITSVQQSLLLRELEFRQLFYIKLIVNFMPALLSIPLAFYGFGVWALVSGTLAAQLVNAFVLWYRSAWRPRMRFKMAIARRVFRFGFWVVCESFGVWFLQWGDSLIVGKLLGVYNLGVYRLGNTIVISAFGLFIKPVWPILYPTFARMKGQISELMAVFRKMNRIMIALALPLGAGFFLVGPQIANVLYGNKWQGLGLVVSMIGLSTGMSWMIGINTEFFRALGRPDVNSKVLLCQNLFFQPAYYVGASHGLEAFVYVRLLLAILIELPINWILCVKITKFDKMFLWDDAKYIFLATLIMIGSVHIANEAMSYTGAFDSYILKLLIAVVCGGVVYAIATAYYSNDLLLSAKKIIKKMV